MNKITTDLLRPAYEDALRSQNKRTPIAPIHLAYRIDRLHMLQTVEAWAARTLAAVPADRLLSLAPTLYGLINEAGQGWEPPDEGYEIEWAADAIAALRWGNRAEAGKIEYPEYETKELEDWLRPRQEPQMSLFAEVG